MIDFNKELVFRGLQILKEDDDLFDIAEDFENTKRIMKQVQYSELMLLPDPAEQMRRLQEANNQDQYLRNKYPDIEEMLLAAEMLSKEQGRASSQSKALETNEYKLLKQDCYGIVLHVLKEKRIVTRVEEYIEIEMDTQEYKKILEGIILPGSLSFEEQAEAIKPLDDYLSTCFPKRLYKYRRCCEDHISAFYENQVWVATAQDMNDGFDARMYFDKNEVLNNVLDATSSNEIRFFIQNLKSDISFQKQTAQLPGGSEALVNVFLPDEYLEEGIKSARAYLIPEINRMMDNLPSIPQQTLKMACFSETVKSSSMWGQYSENETGFCLEYAFENNNGRAQAIDGDLRTYNIYPMIYQPERFQVASSFIEYLLEYQMFFRNGLRTEKNVNVSELQNQLNRSLICPDLFMLNKISLHKSQEWEYEKEWRLFCNSNDSAFQAASRGHFVKKPSAIYLGRRISKVNEKILKALSEEKGIPVYKMKLDDTSTSYDLAF